MKTINSIYYIGRYRISSNFMETILILLLDLKRRLSEISKYEFNNIVLK